MKDIPGFEGRYAVTEDGMVWSYPKTWVTKNQFGTKHETRKGGFWLKLENNFGYRRVILSKNNKIKRFRVHRLVAEVYIVNPEHKRQVNHKNGIKHDNRVENLEWATSSENLKHSFRNLRRKASKSMLGVVGEKHVQSQQVAEVNESGEILHVYGGLLQCDRKNGFPLQTTAGYFNKNLKKTHKKIFKKITLEEFYTFIQKNEKT